MRIAIVGYGTAGQAAAIGLSRDGHQVDVFERAPVLGPVGAGFLLQPVGLQVLRELGLLDAALQHGAIVRRLYGESSDGRVVMDMRYRDLDTRLFGLGMQRGALFGLLDAAWQEGRQVHCGHHVVDVDAERGVLRFKHGDEAGAFDLVLIADGSASVLRDRVTRPGLNRPYPWGAQWCLVDQADWPWTDALTQRYKLARRMAGMLPVGTRPGDATPRMSFFWSVPVASMEASPPTSTQWREQLAEVWPDAATRMQHTAFPEGLAQARYRDMHARCWGRGRAWLIGDAAHAMSPQLGQGVNMALLDALGVRHALRNDGQRRPLAEAMREFGRQRRAHLRLYHFWSRWLTPLFQSDRDRIAWLRDRCFNRLAQLPLGRGQTLRVLTGTRHGWFGSMRLDDDLLQRMDAHQSMNCSRASSA